MAKPQPKTPIAARPISEPPQADAPIIKVRIKFGFRGRLTNEKYIEPGIYREDDPGLFGLANYLVDSGQAEYVTE